MTSIGTLARPRFFHLLWLLILAAAVVPVTAQGQMTRNRAEPNAPVDEVFWAPTIINTSSVTNLEKRNLNFTIMHVFGVLSNGVEDLFGLDASANIRFGLDYGITNRLSVGAGRSRFDKLYDGRFKLNVLRQAKRRGSPIEFALKGSVGVTTLKNGFDLVDRLSYHAAVLIARRFDDRLSIQITPMYAHFNTVFKTRDAEGNVVEEQNDHFAVAVGGRIVLSEKVALTAEYVPVFGDRSDGTVDAFGFGFDIETGGHVFQLFFTTSQWLTEQHLVARNTDDFARGGRRLGFNVNRVFSL
ncbi:MAG: hypothetical protein HKN13_15240 [Rhodothermales bacterium]|nr:hypothetical protein [Rhodothermales bacterium]